MATCARYKYCGYSSTLTAYHKRTYPNGKAKCYGLRNRDYHHQQLPLQASTKSDICWASPTLLVRVIHPGMCAVAGIALDHSSRGFQWFSLNILDSDLIGLVE